MDFRKRDRWLAEALMLATTQGTLVVLEPKLKRLDAALQETFRAASDARMDREFQLQFEYVDPLLELSEALKDVYHFEMLDWPEDVKREMGWRPVPASDERPGAPRSFDVEQRNEILARFIGIVQLDRFVTREDLAKQLGVAPSTLYKKNYPWGTIRTFLLSKDRTIPSGFKDQEGEIGAWEKPPPKTSK